MVFLANRFPRLIILPTSAIFVSGTSGITAILKYRSVNSVSYTHGNYILDKANDFCYIKSKD